MLHHHQQQQLNSRQSGTVVGGALLSLLSPTRKTCLLGLLDNYLYDHSVPQLSLILLRTKIQHGKKWDFDSDIFPVCLDLSNCIKAVTADAGREWISNSWLCFAIIPPEVGNHNLSIHQWQILTAAILILFQWRSSLTASLYPRHKMPLESSKCFSCLRHYYYYYLAVSRGTTAAKTQEHDTLEI